MKRITAYIFVLVLVSVFIFVSAYSQEDMIVVDNSVFDNPQRVPSVFEHDKHNETSEVEDCSECHHVYEDGKKVEDESSEDQSCSECHEKEASDNKPALMKAFHMNCKGCHQENKKGPVMCGECHVRHTNGRNDDNE
jgi:cytochrome c553